MGEPPVAPPPASRAFVAREHDVRLACRIHGEGRALVVTPGGPGGYGVLWDWVLAPLTEQYRLVLWDHRGCGDSTPVVSTTVAAATAT